jgi:hypothetical protein
MTTNDDMVIHSTHWAEKMVARLLFSPAGTDFGVVGTSLVAVRSC